MTANALRSPDAQQTAVESQKQKSKMCAGLKTPSSTSAIAHVQYVRAASDDSANGIDGIILSNWNGFFRFRLTEKIPHYSAKLFHNESSPASHTLSELTIPQTHTWRRLWEEDDLNKNSFTGSSTPDQKKKQKKISRKAKFFTKINAAFSRSHGQTRKKTPPLKNCADEKKNLRKNSRHFVSVCQYFGDLRFAVSFSPFSFCQTFCQTHGWHSFYFRLRRPLDGGRVAGSIPDSSVRFTSLHSHPILRMVFLSKRFLNHFFYWGRNQGFIHYQYFCFISNI